VRFAVVDYAPRIGESGAAARIQRTEGNARTEFWVFQAQPGFDARNRPDRYTVEFQGLRKTWVSRLRLVSDPGAVITLWLGGALATLGLLATLLGAHRRIWARVEPGAVLLAGSSHRHSARFRQQVAELASALAGAGSAGGP
jgi:cytochrome c biogenesis protein ResB